MAFVGRFMEISVYVCTVYLHPNTQYKNSRIHFVKSPADHLWIQNVSKNEAHQWHICIPRVSNLIPFSSLSLSEEMKCFQSADMASAWSQTSFCNSCSADCHASLFPVSVSLCPHFHLSAPNLQAVIRNELTAWKAAAV